MQDSVWKKFEIDCTDYLNGKFGEYATFIHLGEEDSRHADILVKTKKGDSFFIDVKHSPAQGGQFVLLPNIETKTFNYSPRNVNKSNEYTKLIMEYMNSDFDGFRNAGTAGKIIEIPNGEDVFSSWVIENYKSKGVRFFITNNFTILPVEQFKAFFDITATYRIKRSGSKAVGKTKHGLIKNYLSSTQYSIQTYHTEGDKLFVTSLNNLHNQRFIFGKYEYMFSQRGCEYEIRQLSNTYNANVIFPIQNKQCISGLSDAEFICELK